MYEKVGIFHPDKIADRIAGAIVDLAYQKQENPKIAVEVLIGHENCHIIAETSVAFEYEEIKSIVNRIVPDYVYTDYKEVPQDVHLADNQVGAIRCGDNGIFKGVPITDEQKRLAEIVEDIYEQFPSDGKYIISEKNSKLIICQSKCVGDEPIFDRLRKEFGTVVINPLGYWDGGINSDTGATNRKLGSDMGDSVTGGGLCLSGDSEYIGSDLKWHRIDEYDGGLVGQWNDGNLEFVLPNKYIVNEHDDLIYIHNNSKLSMCVTPNHQMLIKTSKGNFIKRPASDIAKKLEQGIGNSGLIIHNFKYDTSDRISKFDSEKAYRLQVAFCADGTLLPKNNKYSGRIRVKKEYKKERLRWLLDGTDYRESVENNGEFSIFWIKPPIWNKSLYECFKDEPLEILCDEVLRWDGDVERGIFRTTKKEDADFIQFSFASCGKVATITYNDRIGREKGKYVEKSICYNVNVLKSDVTYLRKSHEAMISVEYYNDNDSFCFEVPSHNLVIRHDNKIFITGNCGKDLSKADVSVNIYAWLKAQEIGEPVELYCAIGDETIDGKPYSEIVKIAKDYIDSIGGFEKFSEYGLIRS